MGFSISWLAVRGKESESVLRDLGLEPTGECDELPAESPIGGAALPGGWYVVVCDRYEHELVRDEVVKRVSRGAEAVTAGAEEHVMVSFAAGWRDGERLWWTRHDADKGIYDLQAEGALPEGFEDVRRSLLDAQDAEGGSEADVDSVFSIPVEAAKLATGFAYDETEPDGGFAVLARA